MPRSKRSIQRDIRKANTAISAADHKIQEYQDARTVLQDFRTSNREGVSSLRTSYNKMVNDAKLLNVKTTNVFEGELANTLAAEVSNVRQKIDTTRERGGLVTNAIAAQVAKIDEKIDELRTLKGDYETTLSTLNDELRNLEKS